MRRRLADFDAAAAQLCQAVTGAHRLPGQPWPAAVHAEFGELLAFLDADLPRARLLVVDSLLGEAELAARRRRLLQRWGRTIDRDRPRGSGMAGSAPLDGCATAGAVAAIVHARLLMPAPGLTELTSPLADFVVLAAGAPNADV